MARIKENYYHIKGTPTQETEKQNAHNYVGASLSYDKGKGYVMLIHRYSRWTWHDDKYGDSVMESFTMGDRSPCLREYLIQCNRASKKREAEAIELFEKNVLNAVIDLGYEID